MLERWQKKTKAAIQWPLRFLSKKWVCPICNYRGPFLDDHTTGQTAARYAECPNCGSWPRHRLEFLVLEHLARSYDFSRFRLIHFAPEPFLRSRLSSRFKIYTTADLNMNGVDLCENLTDLSIEDGAYDMVIACHVLEHIPQDRKAISEIRRILTPKGLAILAVPINNPRTVDYPQPNPAEAGHVRAPGPDYFDRFSESFSRVEIFSSEQFPKRFQTSIWTDWSRYPTSECPYRLPIEGNRHNNRVAVCHP